MTEHLQQLVEWISLNPLWAGVIVFLIAMAESLAIVGILVPGVVMMFGIGALIATGILEFWPTFGWAVLGAVAGDGLSFFLGRYYQQQLTGIWPFTRYPQMLDRGIRFFERYGGKSVVFGRFVGPVRAVIPLVAGMMRMPSNRFLVANIGSALAWAPAYLLPGMVFGASLELASEVALRLVTLLVLLLSLIWFVTGMIRMLFRLMHPHASTAVQAILKWSRMHPRFGKIAAALADPDHPEAKGLAILASLLILSTGLFALVFYGVTEGSKLGGLDSMVLQGLQSLRTPWADHLMLVFTYLADMTVITALILSIIAFLLLKRHHRTLVHWLGAAAFGLLASPILKYILQIPRPELGIAAVGPYAFPSDHVMRATVLYGFLAVIIARALTARWRWLAYGSAGLLILLVTLSRLYLGVHWLSDVLGSLTLGLAWVAALGIAYNRHIDAETRWPGLTLCAAATLMLALGLQTWRYQESDLTAYTPARASLQMDLEAWWTQGWRQLPLRREDLRNSRIQPLNIQYAGPLDALQSSLSLGGWKPARTLSWENSLKLLSPSAVLAELPLLPQVHDGRHEELALERYASAEERLVLRLWPTDFLLQPGGIRLWQGNVSSQKKTQVLSLFAFPTTRPDFGPPYAVFLQDIARLPHRQPDGAVELVLLRLKIEPEPHIPGRAGAHK